jgi:hypothetical protein
MSSQGMPYFTPILNRVSPCCTTCVLGTSEGAGAATSGAGATTSGAGGGASVDRGVGVAGAEVGVAVKKGAKGATGTSEVGVAAGVGVSQTEMTVSSGVSCGVGGTTSSVGIAVAFTTTLGFGFVQAVQTSSAPIDSRVAALVVTLLVTSHSSLQAIRACYRTMISIPQLGDRSKAGEVA